jgi:hypothetical protein
MNAKKNEKLSAGQAVTQGVRPVGYALRTLHLKGLDLKADDRTPVAAELDADEMVVRVPWPLASGCAA